MSCENCTELRDVIRCNSKINFGTYTADASVNIYFKDLGTNKLHKVESTVSGAGDLIVTHGLSFRNGQTYRIWLNEDDQTIEEMKQWTLPDGTTTTTCVLLRFLDAYDSNGDIVTQGTISLQSA